MKCRPRVAPRITRSLILPVPSSRPCTVAFTMKIRCRAWLAGLAKSAGSSKAFSAAAMTSPSLRNRQILAQNLPLLLTDSGNRKKFFDALVATLLFTKLDNPVREHGTNARQSFELFRRCRVEVKSEQ